MKIYAIEWKQKPWFHFRVFDNNSWFFEAITSVFSLELLEVDTQLNQNIYRLKSVKTWFDIWASFLRPPLKRGFVLPVSLVVYIILNPRNDFRSTVSRQLQPSFSSERVNWEFPFSLILIHISFAVVASLNAYWISVLAWTQTSFCGRKYRKTLAG